MPVELNDRTASPAHAEHLSASAELLLGLLGRSDAELDVSIVDDSAIHELNREYRGRDRPTDVLSFPQLEEGAGEEMVAEPGADPGGAPVHLGDVVISIETAARQAQSGGWTLDEELARLLLHGVLHLLGYDHEQDAERAAIMQAEEARLAEEMIAAGIPCAREEPA